MFDSNVIRKEQSGGYQAWRLDDFAGGGRGGGEVALPTVAELEQIRHAAHAEGYAAGLQEGRDEVVRQAAQLRALTASLQEAVQSVDREVAQQLLQLALGCARKVVHHALQVKPELVVECVREAIAELPVFKGALSVVLHPADIDLVRAALDTLAQDNNIVLRTDAAVQRGGCRLQTAESAIDAGIDTRWQRVAEALSLESEVPT